ncbi:class I SAM-dependent methyltransferase [Candidatus Falkowbacteria bacterium]|nr:class I SAM-dependent methyltransferase [Candidatus Falkowbacteria bacterium]
MTKINHDAVPGKLDHCQITGSKNLFEAIDLGHQPPCDALLTDETINQPEAYYPLRLMISSESGLGQLDHVVDGGIIYPYEYPYRAGVSAPLVEYLKSFADDIAKRFKVPSRSLCVDIGCNDGTLLTGFKRYGMRTIGVEPTNMAKFAWKENKIKTIRDFFTESVAKDIIVEYGRAKVITMTNVFAHMATLGEVMRGISRLLDKDGIFVTESQYLLDVLEGNQFDQVYHEHIRIYSLKSLVKLFPYYGMEVFDAARVGAREGSIRVYVGRRGTRPVSAEVGKLLKLEEKIGLFKPEAWAKWRERVEENRYQFMKLAYEARRRGLHFVADSCPGRGTVLVNYYGLDKTLLPYIAQLPESEKVGKYLPGTHIPIVSNEIILKEKPDYIVILAWHYADYIMKNWRKKGVKSKFVLPLSKFRIIS